MGEPDALSEPDKLISLVLEDVGVGLKDMERTVSDNSGEKEIDADLIVWVSLPVKVSCREKDAPDCDGESVLDRATVKLTPCACGTHAHTMHTKPKSAGHLMKYFGYAEASTRDVIFYSQRRERDRVLEASLNK